MGPAACPTWCVSNLAGGSLRAWSLPPQGQPEGLPEGRPGLEPSVSCFPGEARFSGRPKAALRVREITWPGLEAASPVPAPLAQPRPGQQALTWQQEGGPGGDVYLLQVL